MLSSVLRSGTAIQTSIKIMDAFVTMRKFMLVNAQVFQRLDSLEKHQLESDIKINELFECMDKYSIDNTQGIFFQGQIFDAYAKFESFIAQAKRGIILIDNYVDDSVLSLLDKRGSDVSATVYTRQISSQLRLGASIKDLGKKWFGFTLMKDISSRDILERIASE